MNKDKMMKKQLVNRLLGLIVLVAMSMGCSYQGLDSGNEMQEEGTVPVCYFGINYWRYKDGEHFNREMIPLPIAVSYALNNAVKNARMEDNNPRNRCRSRGEFLIGGTLYDRLDNVVGHLSYSDEGIYQGYKCGDVPFLDLELIKKTPAFDADDCERSLTYQEAKNQYVKYFDILNERLLRDPATKAALENKKLSYPCYFEVSVPLGTEATYIVPPALQEYLQREIKQRKAYLDTESERETDKTPRRSLGIFMTFLMNGKTYFYHGDKMGYSAIDSTRMRVQYTYKLPALNADVYRGLEDILIKYNNKELSWEETISQTHKYWKEVSKGLK